MSHTSERASRAQGTGLTPFPTTSNRKSYLLVSPRAQCKPRYSDAVLLPLPAMPGIPLRFSIPTIVQPMHPMQTTHKCVDSASASNARHPIEIYRPYNCSANASCAKHTKCNDSEIYKPCKSSANASCASGAKM